MIMLTVVISRIAGILTAPKELRISMCCYPKDPQLVHYGTVAVQHLHRT